MQYAERDGPIGEIVRRQWRETSLRVLTSIQATEPTPGTDRGDEMPPALKGHALGGIPETSEEGGTISGDPDTTDACTRLVAKRLATGRALAADLILQHDTFLAAHVLSSSCANSCVVVQAAPTAAAHVPDARLRLRFGVPCVMPLDQWRCNCFRARWANPAQCVRGAGPGDQRRRPDRGDVRRRASAWAVLQATMDASDEAP